MVEEQNNIVIIPFIGSIALYRFPFPVYVKTNRIHFTISQ